MSLANIQKEMARELGEEARRVVIEMLRADDTPKTVRADLAKFCMKIAGYEDLFKDEQAQKGKSLSEMDYMELVAAAREAFSMAGGGSVDHKVVKLQSVKQVQPANFSRRAVGSEVIDVELAE